MASTWQPSAADLGAQFRRRESDPVQHLELVLRRAEMLNPRLNAIVARADVRAAAQESAKRYAQRRPRSLLDGVPLLVKDNILAKGMPCVWGSRVFRDYVPAEDELPVARPLLEAELLERGIDRGLADAVLHEAFVDRDEDSEALELAREKVRTSPARLTPEAVRRRAFAYLARRGFDEETARQAVEIAAEEYLGRP